ncbi:ATP-binding protein [Desulfovulcanus sp.]
MAGAKQIDLNFSVNSRLPLLLGDELIPAPGYAVFELVKNAHDADATIALVDLINVDDANIGKITVEDDGSGMDFEDIVNSWMVLGTPTRRSQIRDGKLTEKYHRPFLGEKGIGRFAAHKLGSHINLITRKKGEPEYVITIDWDSFDPEEPKLISEIPIRIVERDPKKFTDNSTGTLIEISKIRDQWTRGQVRELNRDINSICSPFDSPTEFKAVLTVHPQKKWLDSLFDYEKIDDYALFKSDCIIMGKDFTYKYSMKTSSRLKKRIEGREFELKDTFKDATEAELSSGKELPPHHFSPEELAMLENFGTIKLHMHMFDLTPEVLNLLVPADKSGLRRFLKENGGIKVYRNGIRVFGLGGAGEDWLNLGGRRVQLPQRRLSNNQIIGTVMLGPDTGDLLKEQTNRRGFTENFAFRTLRKALLYVISQIEAERFKDKERLKAALSGTKVKAPVLYELAQLRESISKLVPEEAQLLEPSLARVEKAYNETKEMLVTAASSGMALAGIIHETEKQIKNLVNALKEDSVDIDYIREMVRQLSVLMEGITYILRKSPIKKQSMSRVVKHVLFNAKHRFKYHKINIINGFDNKPDLSVSCSRSLISTAILNLIDNAIWWLENKGHKNKIMYIGPSTEFELGPALIVADNGSGIIDPPEDIIKPFFSRKPNGMGLGLYLVNEAMVKQNGLLVFPEVGDVELPKDIDGAIIGLVFGGENGR